MTETPTEAPKKWINYITVVFKSGTQGTIYFDSKDQRDAAYAELKETIGTANFVEIECQNGRAMIAMAEVISIYASGRLRDRFDD